MLFTLFQDGKLKIVSKIWPIRKYAAKCEDRLRKVSQVQYLYTSLCETLLHILDFDRAFKKITLTFLSMIKLVDHDLLARMADVF